MYSNLCRPGALGGASATIRPFILQDSSWFFWYNVENFSLNFSGMLADYLHNQGADSST
jgi:hypothetical protein